MDRYGRRSRLPSIVCSAGFRERGAIYRRLPPYRVPSREAHYRLEWLVVCLALALALAAVAAVA